MSLVEKGFAAPASPGIARLDLGADLSFLKVRFRHPRGADANLPARLWAKAAVRTIEDTRARCLCFGQLIRDFGSCEALVEFTLGTGWEMSKGPSYMEELLHLGRFSRASLPGWKRFMRKMVRQAIPDLHTRPKWATQRSSAMAGGRNTPGEIQNAILDDIVSALGRLARA